MPYSPPKCETCRFFVDTGKAGRGEEKYRHGECHIHPPKYLDRLEFGKFPKVANANSCGKHEPIPQVKDDSDE